MKSHWCAERNRFMCLMEKKEKKLKLKEKNKQLFVDYLEHSKLFSLNFFLSSHDSTGLIHLRLLVNKFIHARRVSQLDDFQFARSLMTVADDLKSAIVHSNQHVARSRSHESFQSFADYTGVETQQRSWTKNSLAYNIKATWEKKKLNNSKRETSLKL